MDNAIIRGYLERLGYRPPAGAGEARLSEHLNWYRGYVGDFHDYWMRVGTSRDVALQHMAERTSVPDLRTFVAILVQSNQLGVSIAEVLHSQAALMREKRRQRAEAMARQATVKMSFPLVFFIFPALFVVILGPSMPMLLDLFRSMGS